MTHHLTEMNQARHLGMPEINVLDLICPLCRADAGQPCDGRKRPHQERYEFRKKLLARCEGEDTNARYYRSIYRKGEFPRPNKPHGTFAAYKHHVREGTKPCVPCLKAARMYWRQAKAKQRS